MGTGRRIGLPVLLGVVAVGVIAAVGAAYLIAGGRSTELRGGIAGGQGTELRGIATLWDLDGSMTGSWDNCEGTGGYSDFSAGMNLSITDREGNLIGSGEVWNVSAENLSELAEIDRIAHEAGNELIGTDRAASEDEIQRILQDSEGIGCMLFFKGVVEDSAFYSIELGDHGNLDYSRAEMQENRFIVPITLGDTP